MRLKSVVEAADAIAVIHAGDTVASAGFCTLGCYPLMGAVESDADTMAGVIGETLNVTTSRRQGAKKEGYF